MTIHLREITLSDNGNLPNEFPFNLSVVKNLDCLQFKSPITFFVGENGSGKSTILEAIATGAQLPTIGSTETSTDDTLDGIKKLSNHLKWVWSKRIRTGFFMRSEDFFGFAKRISSEVRYLKEQLESDEESHEGQSTFAKTLSKAGYARDYRALKDLYGDGLDTQSHGESYFKLFNARFRPNGLYLMDEPEAPLSPNRQLTLIAILKQMIDQNAQFIIATHSPILLAYPDATIYDFTGGQIVETDYDSLEHVQITRQFLNNPESYLKHLLQ